MKKKFLLLTLTFTALFIQTHADVTHHLDSLITRDVDNICQKAEKYQYTENDEIAVVFKYNNTGKYLKMDSAIYVYDNQGNILFKEAKTYPLSSRYPGWRGSSKSEFTYNGQNLVTKQIDYMYKQPTDGTVGYYYQSSGYDYTYDALGNMLTKTMSSGTYSSEGLTPKLYYRYTYDENNNCILEEDIDKDEDGNWTIVSSTKTYLFNSNNQKTSCIDEKIDLAGDGKGSKEKEEYTYDPTTGDLTEIVAMEWIENAWVNKTKKVQTYGNPTFLLSETNYEWTNDAWLATSSIEYTRNLHNLATTVKYFKQNSDKTALIQSYESEYQFDELDHQTFYAYYSCDATGEKKGSTKNTWVYDSYDNQLEKISYTWDSSNNVWKYKTKESSSINEEHLVANTVSESWNGNAWEKGTTATYYYANMTGLTTIGTADALKLMISKGSVTIDQVNSNSNVALYNLNGQVVKSLQNVLGTVTFDVPAGLYFVKIANQSIKVLIP